jgi:pilus assembly protein CpaE
MLVYNTAQNATIRRLDELIRTRYGFQDPVSTTLERAETQFVKSNPELVIVVMNSEQAERHLDVVRRLRGIGAARVIVVGPAIDPKMILRSMQFGADLFLDQADLESELESALSRLNAKCTPRSQSGHVIALLSTAGGCGASTLAVNLATLLAKECGKANLIDLNLGKADLGPLLDLKPQYTLADLCRNEDRLDRSMYEKLLTPHTSGVSLLAAPRDYETVRSVSARGIARAITLARETFAQVIIDLQDCFHEEQALALEQTTRILLVCRLDFTSIRSTRYMLDYLTARNIPREKIEIVVNQFGLPNELPIADAEAAIGGKLNYFIPHDPATIGEANNTGIPAAYKNPDTVVAQSIARLVGLESPLATAPDALTRLNGWLRGSVGPRLFRTIGRLSGAATLANTGTQTEELIDTHESTSIPQSSSNTRTCPA